MSPDDWATGTLDRMLAAVPDGFVTVQLRVSRMLYDALLDTPTQQVTLNGSDVPIDRMYEREFPERLVWEEVATDWSGSTTRPAWHVSREVLLHQQELKHERGIRLEIILGVLGLALGDLSAPF